MYEFVSIVIIVFGILQIILFFKVWAMTNNVKNILDVLNSKDTREITADGKAEKSYRLIQCEVMDSPFIRFSAVNKSKRSSNEPVFKN